MKERVYALIKMIPKGSVATYGQIAACLGNKKWARVVGNILHHNPDPANIPCHRVVNSKGRVAPNFAFGGGQAQRALLLQEGVGFQPDGSIDLEKYGIQRRMEMGSLINGCHEGKHTPRLSEVKCPRCGEWVDVFVIMGGRPGQTGTLASDEKCICGHILPAGSYESDYEQ